MAKVITFTGLLIFGGTASILTLMYADHRWSAESACTETAIVMTSANSTKTCGNGGHATTEALGDGRVLFKCACGGK